MPEKADIEKLKRDISELKRSNAALKAEKRILDEILDRLPGTFYIWDDRPRLIRWNKMHEEITEYSRDDYVNMRPTDFFNKKEHRAIEAAVEKTFTDGEATMEATLVTKSGKKIPHVYSAVRTMMGDKPVLMGFGIDISKRKKVEQQLRAILSEMEVLKNQLEAECTYLGEEIKLMHDHEHIIGESEVMKYILYSLEQIAPTDIMNDLKAYPWPGNVRELENVIERAVIITRGSMLQLAAPLKAPESGDNTPLNVPMKSLSEMEKAYILQALRKNNWKIHGKDGTAVLLDINPSTLRGRMRKHGIDRPPYKT